MDLAEMPIRARGGDQLSAGAEVQYQDAVADIGARGGKG
jgi:hypothetical protein